MVPGKEEGTHTPLIADTCDELAAEARRRKIVPSHMVFNSRADPKVPLSRYKFVPLENYVEPPRREVTFNNES